MTKEEIIKYTLSTPGNTNPNILRGMLGSLMAQSSGGGLVVNAVSQGLDSVLSETYKTIKTAMDAGRVVVIRNDNPDVSSIVVICGIDGANYSVYLSNGVVFKTSSEDGYPTADGGK